MNTTRKSYPSDVTDAEWEFLVPYLTLMREDAPQRERTFGWLGRFRRLARDYERLSETLSNWHWLAFLGLLLAKIGIQSA